VSKSVSEPASEYRLHPMPFLGGYDQVFSGLSLREAVGLAIVSIALPRGNPAGPALEKAFGTALPEVGKSANAANDKYRLLRLGSEQVFVLFEHATADAESEIAALIGGAAYTTDQTDSWVALSVQGARVRAVLARICPLDLHGGVFAIGNVARTSMEHLGTIILRTDEDQFLLLSASSSAQSFLHALETSIRYTA